MPNGQNPVVEQALNECAEQFTNGVESYSKELRIDTGVIEKLKARLRGEFTKRLVEEGRIWEDDKQYVVPMGFYTGALAAGRVHNIDKLVTEVHAGKALDHISEHCHGPVKDATDSSRDDLRPMWFYCPWR